MTALERTAYPYFKQSPSSEELDELYTPTADELELAKIRVRLVSNRLSFLVLLKSFQRLGYFPHPEVIPVAVINHIRKQLNLAESVSEIAQQLPFVVTIRSFATISKLMPTTLLPKRSRLLQLKWRRQSWITQQI